ncbi:transmembrane protein, putative (macronuclear) [Tetrahymena thermophila SB210]|uniref:Transmembrane protein, putative n=1 Tax=Tetrahymena thermophila (strain SB210) TaxID=312017 RepID=W7X3R3_TETTS|nr:transmembrane protein, putative [Tetrahymena thermophila SB210]EWS72097.1 transmembrane protein, putative [Tetrahymena thermophila SB210]|eukprot:XP_012655408.1 transmembrane protein, putative [Tetrahymena thermophila SB210]
MNNITIYSNNYNHRQQIFQFKLKIQFKIFICIHTVLDKLIIYLLSLLQK